MRGDANEPSMTCRSEIDELLSLSARIGADPLLAQASNGNTSIKLSGTLWIKASGKWLAHAAEEKALVPLCFPELLRCLEENEQLPVCTAPGTPLRASIETAMHAVLPHRVVIHAHSVNTISWAVRRDAEQRLAERLHGLHWQLIPYVSSGLPLARAIEKAIGRDPLTNIFVLSNHGLVVCGDNCEAAEKLLSSVEARLDAPPRSAPDCDCGLPAETEGLSGWRMPENPELHSLATDPVSRRILRGGILYPCQAIFLGRTVPMLPASVSLPRAMARFESFYEDPPFWIVEGRGVLVNERLTKAQEAILKGLLHVVQRIEESAPVRYVSDTELSDLLNEDAHGYRQSAERYAVLGAGNIDSQPA